MALGRPRRCGPKYALDARIPPSCPAPPSRGRYRGRGRACVSDPTQGNKRGAPQPRTELRDKIAMNSDESGWGARFRKMSRFGLSA
jgi:hypothetical protein